MRWRLLVVIAVILAITGVLLFTEQGRKYAISLGSMTRGLASSMGNFVGSLVKISQKEEFNINLEVNKEAIYGQSFSFSSGGFESFGRILSLKIDGKNWEIGEKVKIEFVGNGEISVGSDGKVNLKVEANSLKLNSWKTSDVKVEIEMIPENFMLNNAKTNLINITSASGNLVKQLEDIELKVEFNQARLKVEGFGGTIQFGEKLKLTGTATNIEINGKKV